MRLSITVAIVWSVGVLSAQQASPASARVVPADSKLIYYDRDDHCGVPAIARVLSSALATPFGIEHVPGKCEGRNGPVVFRAAGMTVAQVLDRAIEVDPRYAWAEDNGVLVVRPVEAWNSPDHFLHRGVESFDYDDLNIGFAHALVNVMLGHLAYKTDRAVLSRKDASPEPDYRFAVRLQGPTNALDVMNAIARAHRRMTWEIDYCQPKVMRDLALIHFITWPAGGPVQTSPGRFRVTDGGIIGDRVWWPDGKGGVVNPCDATAVP
jgi:hypothetical protein